MSFIYYVGIDPSLTATGLAILDSDGKMSLRTIRTTPTSHGDKFHRVRHIAMTLRQAIADLDGKSVVCIEAPYIDLKNGKVTRAMIEMHTMVQHLLYWGGIHFREIPPAKLKQFVANHGAAKKELMLKKVFQLWKIDTDDNNQADAAGLAQMSRAIHSVQSGGERSEWHAYQLEIVRKILDGEK